MIRIHYHRFRHDYDGWTLWTWRPGDDTSSREFASRSVDEFGCIFELPYPPDAQGLGFLPKFQAWRNKDGPDRFWRAGMPQDLYVIEDDETVYESAPSLTPRIKIAYVDSPTAICVNFVFALPTRAVTPRTLVLRMGETAVPLVDIQPWNETAQYARTYLVNTKAPLDLEALRARRVWFEYDGMRAGPLVPRYVLDQPEYICELPLGPQVDAHRFFLRVWAPAALSVRVVMAPTPPLPDPKTEPDAGLPLIYAGRGVWELQQHGDFQGWHYRLHTRLLHDPERIVAVYDPYARALDRQAASGILVNDATPVASGPSFPIDDAIIYELHVRDYTHHRSANCRKAGTFLGLVERDTALTNSAGAVTGFDHLCELGVNTVQLMPVQAIALRAGAQHDWGYMTLQFNAPEPSYATDGHGVTAVREFKQTVDALHRAGFKVVMDVVYNHSTESRTHAVHWNGLAPDYFYRARPDGSYWNGSGCGNEFRSESPMARKFLLDSLLYWTTAYGIDGFRFDLMGLIDRQTMDAVVAALRAVRPDILLYGEPWVGGETPINITAKGAQQGAGCGCFNDHYRDAIAGNVFSDEPGYCLDGRNRDEVRRGLAGGLEWFADAPRESVNYVECHDNRTLRDKLADGIRTHLPRFGAADAIAADRLAAFLLFMAQGVPFIQMGQEFYRSKFGAHNSYDGGDAVNNVDWSDKQTYGGLYRYYRGLVALRRAHPLLRLRTREEVERRLFFGVVKPPYLVVELDGEHMQETWRRALLLINPEPEIFRYALPEAERDWQVFVAAHLAAATPLHTLGGRQNVIQVYPRSATLVAEPKES